jgi:SAM-dependent methyltransferase
MRQIADEVEPLLRPTVCAICRTLGNAQVLYPARLGAATFAPQTFSARRLPDGEHYRVVRCATCGLVRSDPAAEPGLLEQLYGRSTFDYGDQVAGLRRTYRRYLDALDRYGAAKTSLLEIGCGNGFFLEEALASGFAEVRGVEPSRAAVEQAGERVRSSIVCDVMRAGLFGPGEFDVICLFQVLDHLPNPGEVLDECRRALRPEGLILCLNHNVNAVSARLLRSRSPIIDVEHTYLYSRRTIAELFGQHGFAIERIGSAVNTFGLGYLARLTPLPRALKTSLLSVFSAVPALRDMELSLPLGNLFVVARPAHGIRAGNPM